jgi:hypothetical protein
MHAMMTKVRNWVRDGLSAALLGEARALQAMLELKAERYQRIAGLLVERVPSRGGDG